jgi:hypothetical protein
MLLYEPETRMCAKREGGKQQAVVTKFLRGIMGKPGDIYLIRSTCICGELKMKDTTKSRKVDLECIRMCYSLTVVKMYILFFTSTIQI